MYPFAGSPLNFGAMRFGPQMGVQGMNNGVQGMNMGGVNRPITAAQLLGMQGFGNQAAPITPRQFAPPPQAPQMAPVAAPQMAPQMQQQPMGLLSRNFGQGGRNGPGRGGGFGGGQGTGAGGFAHGGPDRAGVRGGF